VHELLQGGAGNDTLFAGKGGDTLDGGTGDDTFHVGSHGNDTIDGGTGANTVFFDNHDSNHVSISAPVSGVTTVTFTDTHQTFAISDVQTIHFDDGTHHNL
jgi:Ca2+-binding RTX toxin-like protein